MTNWLNDFVSGLSPAEYYLYILALIILIVAVLHKLNQSYHHLRFVSDTPTSRIASAAQGYVELKGLGELMPGSSISSPFSHQRCLWYQCKVEKKQRIGRRSVWVEDSNEISDHLFNLEDDSGRCVVNPDGARVIPSKQSIWYGSSLHSRHQGALKTGWFNRMLGMGHYRFTEKLILVADPLYVIGWLHTITSHIHPQTLKQQVDSLVETWKQYPHRYLKSFDMDKNGKIQKQEWSLIRQHAEQQVIKRHQAPDYHLIQKPLEKNHPYIISSLSERQLKKRHRWHLFLYLVLFFLLLYVLLFAVNI